MTHFGIDKSVLKEYNNTKKEILKEIKPSTTQNLKEKRFVDSLLKKINKMKGPHNQAIIAGSFGRDTHLKNSKDYDIFVLYPPSIDHDEFVENGLEIGKNVFKGNFWEKAYSQHPYIRGIIDNYKIEIVPAYDIKDTSQLKSAVDRTPFHLNYLKKKLKRSQRDEVRLLKYFLRKINCYGADSQFEGFSGYLCELLILKYKDFIGVLEAVSNWKRPIKLFLEEDHESALDAFNDEFIVIDPTDSSRNVASAVSSTTLSKFMAASRVFLKSPSLYFFKRRIVNNLTYHQLVGKIDTLPLVCLQLETKDMLKDIVWSKINMISKKLEKHLEQEDFKILKIQGFYREEDDYAYIFILVNSLFVPKYSLNVGPKVSDLIHSENFINNTRCILGPYIKNDRWYSIKKRNKNFIKPIVLAFLFDNFKIPTKLYVDKEIRNLYLKDTGISYQLSKFFQNKEDFLI